MWTGIFRALATMRACLGGTDFHMQTPVRLMPQAAPICAANPRVSWIVLMARLSLSHFRIVSELPEQSPVRWLSQVVIFGETQRAGYVHR